jgi:hypothetical protein
VFGSHNNQEATMSPTAPKDGRPGTTDQSPRWEGPEENRPAGYLPALDDPEQDPDAAGETLDNSNPQAPDTLTRRNEEQARKAPRDTEYAGHPEFSQDAAGNKPPKDIGNSEPTDDIEAKTRHSEGVNPAHPAPQQ